MMDITVTGIVEASDNPHHFHVYRAALGDDSHIWYGGADDPSVESTNIERMPKEILSIRAAEYGLSVENPRALDMVLLEHLTPHDAMPEFHPLHTEKLKDALKIMDGVMDHIRSVHGQPSDAKFLASAKRNVSAGLKMTKQELLESTDDSIIEAVEHFREVQREVVAKMIEERLPPTSLGRRLRDAMEDAKLVAPDAPDYEIPRGRT